MTDEITRTTEEVVRVLREIGDTRTSTEDVEFNALMAVLDTDRDFIPPSMRSANDLSFVVDGDAVRDDIEQIERKRKAMYKRNMTASADRLAYAQTALEWLLGEDNEGYDEIVATAGGEQQ